LAISNFLIFYILYKIAFSLKLSEIYFNFFISISTLNFALILLPTQSENILTKLKFVITEYLLGLIIVIFFNKFFFTRTEEYQLIYWISIFISSIFGGMLTLINYRINFKTKIDLKKTMLLLTIISALFPLLNLFYFTFIYNKTFYDLSFYSFIPEILIVIIWQIFILYNKKGFT